MKPILTIAMCMAMFFAALNASPTSVARAWGGGGCSLASVSGAYGFSYNGVAILSSGAVPVAAVGNFSTDSSGRFVGSETNSLGGSTTFETIVGAITIKPDCAATLVAKVFQGGTLVRTSYVHLQYLNNATEVIGIFQKLVLPDNSILPVVVTIDGKRISHGD